MTPTYINLAKLRIKADLTQGELADLAGTYQATISNLESGKSQRIELDLLNRLAKALKCKSGDLLIDRKS